VKTRIQQDPIVQRIAGMSQPERSRVKERALVAREKDPTDPRPQSILDEIYRCERPRFKQVGGIYWEPHGNSEYSRGFDSNGREVASIRKIDNHRYTEENPDVYVLQVLTEQVETPFREIDKARAKAWEVYCAIKESDNDRSA
jgi:hypothetical protein